MAPKNECHRFSLVFFLLVKNKTTLYFSKKCECNIISDGDGSPSSLLTVIISTKENIYHPGESRACVSIHAIALVQNFYVKTNITKMLYDDIHFLPVPSFETYTMSKSQEWLKKDTIRHTYSWWYVVCMYLCSKRTTERVNNLMVSLALLSFSILQFSPLWPVDLNSTKRATHHIWYLIITLYIFYMCDNTHIKRMREEAVVT